MLELDLEAFASGEDGAIGSVFDAVDGVFDSGSSVMTGSCGKRARSVEDNLSVIIRLFNTFLGFGLLADAGEGLFVEPIVLVDSTDAKGDGGGWALCWMTARRPTLNLSVAG